MVCWVVLAERVVMVRGECLVCSVQRAKGGLDGTKVLGAKFAECAEGFVYAMKRRFVIGDFEVRRALCDELDSVRRVWFIGAWKRCIRQRDLRREAYWILCRRMCVNVV
jgi:hypothetical protein